MFGDVKDDLHREDYGEYSDSKEDGVVDRRDLRERRRTTAGFASIAILHLGLGAFGGWWLGKRVSARRAIDTEVRYLKVQRKVLEVKLDIRADNTSALGSIVGRF